ncbi:VOC family protein [Amylibacter sp. SFDW26]|uniref:2-oxoadipate dioxygenase/decarboxylase HglS n=1 Tax=Amylibacter sp. SFDW26 TaxID=2652722 RepID=UPI0012613E1D|nr:VOC family protein [Amylibacter sp. SFDW26]KAB7615444.1 VOC family protein [Amylibacter sp. SFDW26]
MTKPPFVHSDTIRAAFSSAMSQMYQTEVPAYGALQTIVAETNERVLSEDPALKESLEGNNELDRISDERHGAIRLGTATELNMMRRVFAIMGMFPVGYYDLGVAGIPVHSTAFRPTTHDALSANPFRVFTSLLRLELINDAKLRDEASAVLAKRQIFTDRAIALVDIAEANGGFTQTEADEFVTEVLETFRWHSDALVSFETYEKLHDAHRLIADVVSFHGPHINHLTPRTLDIDASQDAMPEHGISAKAVIEGPPPRRCPILLRQTSFKALEEDVNFPNKDGSMTPRSHTARFGEIEQRGIALTPKGRALYDQILADVRATITPTADGSNADAYMAALSKGFEAFPDDWRMMLDQELAYFQFSLAHGAKTNGSSVTELINDGSITFDPVVYEDFLPVSAAGIFQSNLGDKAAETIKTVSSQDQFEDALGTTVLNEFDHYSAIQATSLSRCMDALNA